MTLIELNNQITTCSLCERLVSHRTNVSLDSNRHGKYWSCGVPGFGDPNAEILIVGLAPGAHGANRTGRPFTGDFSGDKLFAALYRNGLCNQKIASHLHDGMNLSSVYITNIVKSVPPQNKPSRVEISRCNRYFKTELRLLSSIKVILVLGELVFNEVKSYFSGQGVNMDHVIWGHGPLYQIGPGFPRIKVSFHPSKHNFNASISKFNVEKRMTDEKLDRVVRETIEALLE